MHTFALSGAAAVLLTLALSGCTSAATTSTTPAPAPSATSPADAVDESATDAASATEAELAAIAAAEEAARAAALAAAQEAAAQEAAAQEEANAEVVAEVHGVGKGGRIQIGAGQIAVQASDGSAIETSYFAPSEALRDFITQVYGVAPDVTRSEASGESVPGTIYTWEGIVLADPDTLAQSPVTVDFSVQATSAQVGNVVIEAAGGAQIGDPAAQVATQYPAGASSFTNDAGGTGVMLTGESIDLPTPEGGAIEPFTHSVGLIAFDETAGITSIFAPQTNFLH